MQIQLVVAAVALTIASTMDSAHALAKYLNELPNGSSFQQPLGHPGSDSSKTTDFAQAFAAAGHTWSKSLCEAKFPGSSMTNGAAFGDPCCTWKKGGKPDFTVTAFTTTPGKATTCAAKGGASSTSSAAGTSSGADDATKGASDATESSDTGDSSTGAADATKGGATTESSDTGDSSTGAADATKGGATSESSDTGDSSTGAADATKGGATTETSDAGDSTTGASTAGASATGASAAGASKGSPWGSTPSTPTSGGGCAAKTSRARALRR